MMITVGIDAAKDEHHCVILSSEGEVPLDLFTCQKNVKGFEQLLKAILFCSVPSDKIKVELETTGHYSYNILVLLLEKGLPTFVINHLHTNLYRKSLSRRKIKTDRIDERPPLQLCFCLM